MTSTAPWLSRQLKGKLSEMADVAGMTDYKNLIKKDLEEELDKFLRANQTSLSSNPKLADFYKRLKDGSPAAAGKELIKSETKTPSKARRRTIVPKEDITSDSEPAGTGAATTTASDPKTPRPAAAATRRVQSPGVASAVRLPPSPAQIAEDAERHLASASKWVKQRYARTGIQSHLDAARDKASTSYSITTLAIGLEAVVLLSTLLPLKYLGLTIPAVPALGLAEYHARGPQFWNLLELHFWSTTLLWAAVSVLLPGLAAYFFNLTLKARRHGARSLNSRFDPFTFNVAKALLAWLVFVQHVPLPAAALHKSRLAIEAGVPGGYLWTMTAAGVGVLVSLYEAILRQ